MEQHRGAHRQRRRGSFAQGRSPALEGYLTLSNDLRRHGLSQLATGASWQAGVDYEHASGFFAGAAVANVEYALDARYAKPREHELAYYAGFGWERRRWSLHVSLGRYSYPDTSLDYDYDALSVSATFAGRLFYTASYTDRLYSSPYSARRHELGVAQPLQGNFEISAALGRFESQTIANGSYSHWNAGVSKILRRIGLDLRYHEASLGQVSYIGDPGGDRWVLSVSYAFPAKSSRPR
jgi:uncharacterized protein (TIGR02001 family)